MIENSAAFLDIKPLEKENAVKSRKKKKKKKKHFISMLESDEDDQLAQLMILTEALSGGKVEFTKKKPLKENYHLCQNEKLEL